LQQQLSREAHLKSDLDDLRRRLADMRQVAESAADFSVEETEIQTLVDDLEPKENLLRETIEQAKEARVHIPL